LYGTTIAGGPGGHGTVFRLDLAPEVVSAPPANIIVSPGANVTLNVTAFGTRPLSYQWLANSNALTDGPNVSGAATASLTLFNVAPTNAGTYMVNVSNRVGSVTSSQAQMTVVPAPVLQLPVKTTNMIVLTWSAVPGQKYQVQSKTDLTATTWANLGQPVLAAGSTASATNSTGSFSQGYYRVVVVP
jgi:hypothetical protein